MSCSHNWPSKKNETRFAAAECQISHGGTQRRTTTHASNRTVPPAAIIIKYFDKAVSCLKAVIQKRCDEKHLLHDVYQVYGHARRLYWHTHYLITSACSPGQSNNANMLIFSSISHDYHLCFKDFSISYYVIT